MSLLRTALALLLPLAATAASPNPTVSFASGVVVGTATSVSNQPSVTNLANAYLGVPFAKSPPLRFAPPEPAESFGTRQAQTLPPACLQQLYTGETGEREIAYFLTAVGLPLPSESEDCLYLNVFAPQDASPTNLKPVLFWIYGGNLDFGTASLSYYNGSSLAVNEDVVVVAANYRTNVFGFSASPELPKNEQNAGFLDQRLALQWVQDNIAAFGGDPSRVTIFGESAGGYSVKQLLAQPPSPLPFRAAIMESQQTVVLGDPTVSYAALAAHFGCTTVNATLACLRNVSGTAIQAYIEQENLAFGPMQDDTYVASDSLPQIQSGQFADVPILVGTNKNEYTVFLAMLGLDPILPNVDLSDLVMELLDLNVSAIAEPLMDLYTNASTLTFDVAAQILTDMYFTCTTQNLAQAIASAGRQPVWRYFYEADFPNLRTFPNSGAYHTSEYFSVWGTYQLSNALGDATPTQIALSAYMQQVWANFAKNPFAGPGWPQLPANALGDVLAGDEVVLGVLGGAQNTSGEYTMALKHADFACPLLDPVIIASGMGY